MNLFSKINSFKFKIFKKKIIKYRLIKITKPPISDIGYLCFFNLPSGLSKKIKFFDIVENLMKISKLKRNINVNKNTMLIYFIKTKL